MTSLAGVTKMDIADEAEVTETSPTKPSATQSNSTSNRDKRPSNADTESHNAKPMFSVWTKPEVSSLRNDPQRIVLSSLGRQQSVFQKLDCASSSKRLGRTVWGSNKPVPNNRGVAQMYGHMNYDDSNQFDITAMLRRQSFQAPSGVGQWRSPRVVSCDTGKYVGMETRGGTVVFRSASATSHHGQMDNQEAHFRTVFKAADAARRQSAASFHSNPEFSGCRRLVNRHSESNASRRTAESHHRRREFATACSKTLLHRVSFDPNRECSTSNDSHAEPEPANDFPGRLVEKVVDAVLKRIDENTAATVTSHGQVDDEMRDNDVMDSTTTGDSLNTGSGSSPSSLVSPIVREEKFSNIRFGDRRRNHREISIRFNDVDDDDVRYRDELNGNWNCSHFDSRRPFDGSQRHLRDHHHHHHHHHLHHQTNSRSRHRPSDREYFDPAANFSDPSSTYDLTRKRRSYSVNSVSAGNCIIGCDLSVRPAAPCSSVVAAAGTGSGGAKGTLQLETFDVKILANRLMQKVYEVVRNRVDQALSADYASNSSRQDELRSRADKEVREQVLMAVVDQVVWMVSAGNSTTTFHA